MPNHRSSAGTAKMLTWTIHSLVEGTGEGGLIGQYMNHAATWRHTMIPLVGLPQLLLKAVIEHSAI